MRISLDHVIEMYDPRNRPIVEAILVANASGMTPELAV
jgi:hypothetical protein